jgi:hypothetical protein
VSSLLPEGVDHLSDAPYNLHQAIVFALRVLDWEDFSPDERPPKRIWLDNERLSAHFKEVQRKRDEKYGNKQDDEDDLPDSDPRVQRNTVELITRG